MSCTWQRAHRSQPGRLFREFGAMHRGVIVQPKYRSVSVLMLVTIFSSNRPPLVFVAQNEFLISTQQMGPFNGCRHTAPWCFNSSPAQANPWPPALFPTVINNLLVWTVHIFKCVRSNSGAVEQNAIMNSMSPPHDSPIKQGYYMKKNMWFLYQRLLCMSMCEKGDKDVEGKMFSEYTLTSECVL